MKLRYIIIGLISITLFAAEQKDLPSFQELFSRAQKAKPETKGLEIQLYTTDEKVIKLSIGHPLLINFSLFEDIGLTGEKKSAELPLPKVINVPYTYQELQDLILISTNGFQDLTEHAINNVKEYTPKYLNQLFNGIGYFNLSLFRDFVMQFEGIYIQYHPGRQIFLSASDVKNEKSIQRDKALFVYHILNFMSLAKMEKYEPQSLDQFYDNIFKLSKNLVEFLTNKPFKEAYTMYNKKQFSPLVNKIIEYAILRMEQSNFEKIQEYEAELE